MSERDWKINIFGRWFKASQMTHWNAPKKGGSPFVWWLGARPQTGKRAYRGGSALAQRRYRQMRTVKRRR